MPDLTAHELGQCLRMRAMCACNQLRRASRGMTQVYDAAMGPGDLKVTQLPILVALGSAGDLSVTALAGALGLDRTTLTRNLGVLEKRGLVHTAEHADDARVRVVSLTAEGSRELAAALARWDEAQTLVEEHFGAARLQALYDELAALAGAVSA